LEKKARRDLEKLNETKDQFIMITQHHLRTPVNNIQTKIQSIVAGADEQPVTEIKSALQETDSHLERLVKTVNDFLNITTIKPGGNILNLSRTNPKLLIADILSELKIDIEQKNLTITYPENDESWPTINVDSSKIRDALLIIIENAVKYNNMGGMISIRTIFSDKMLNITVADTGIGISKHDQGKIFSNLFTRSNEAKKMNPIGMGIGLSVAKAIIKAHHGDLAIRSNDQERGTTVIVSIPRDYLSQI
jgi:signal transduction histidine kinase